MQEPEPASSLDQAESDLRRALDGATALALRPLAAHCRVGLARVCVRRGKHHEARNHLVSAIAMYQAMQMPLWTCRAEEVLAAIG